MPCCAFVAFIVSQVVLAFGAIGEAVRRRRGAAGVAPANAVVEWRLSPTALVSGTAARTLAPLGGWRPQRLGWRGLAVAVALDVALLLGALHGLRSHVAQGAGSEAHAEHGAAHCATGGAWEQ